MSKPKQRDDFSSRRPWVGHIFDPFSVSAGVDRDFDDLQRDELDIVEKLRDRGTL